MIQRVACCLLALGMTALAAETDTPKSNESLIRVECLGKLRHGLVAIGGETTGTTISFDGTTWELKLPDDKTRSLAEQNNKKLVTVSGTLRHVRGVEVPSRWIVDVETLAAKGLDIKADPKQESATVSITGPLKWQDATGKDAAGSLATTVSSGGMNWRLDFTQDRSLEAKSKSLDGQTVTAKGRFVRADGAKPQGSLSLQVSSLEAAPKR